MEILRTMILAAAATMVFSVPSFAGNGYSGQAIKESGAASTHSGASIANSVAGTGQVVSAVAAVPFYVVGAVGDVSGEIANGLIDMATAPPGTALEITDEVITAGPPPNDALKEKI